MCNQSLKFVQSFYGDINEIRGTEPTIGYISYIQKDKIFITGQIVEAVFV